MSEEAAKGFTMDEVRSRMSEGTTEAVGSSGPAQGQAMGFTMDEVRAKANQAPQNNASLGDYLKAIPATAADISIGAVEGVASAIGEFTGDYDLARSISETRTDVNDAIMGDAPESVKSDFAYKVASGLGSTIPYLLAAVATKRPSLVTKIGANGFFLASAGQQVRDDYLGTMGVTSETATDEQMSESNKVGAMGAIPIAMAERLGAGVILGAFKSGAIPAGKVMQRIGQYASAGAGEAATEVAQSGIINSIASYVAKYDEDRPITRGMAESALIGFLVGGGVNAGVDTVERAITQGDRLKAGVQDGSINSKDVIDKDVGSKFAAIAMESGSIPEADSIQASTITDPKGMSNFISKTLTPLSQRLGRAGKEVVREFRKYEMNTGLKLKEFKDATAPFSRKMLELKKKSPEDYKILSQALANANELSVSLPDSVQKDLEQKAQLQPEIARSTSEQLLDTTNANAQVINEQIGQARKALEGSGLKTRIQIVESGNSYYDPSTDTIAISAAEADATTVAHEYFHAALGQAVKTDVELQSMTRNMFDSVIRATVSGSAINEQLKGFVSQYDSNVQNEEFLAQTVGELASQYETLDINTKTRIKAWINQAMQKLGMQGAFKEAQTDTEVVEQLNAFSRFAGKPEALTEKINKSFVSEMIDPKGEQAVMSSPIRASKLQLIDFSELPKNVFGKKPSKYSRISGDNVINFSELVSKLKAENAKVSFWAADQFGSGTYTDEVSGKKYNLDGGISFPLDKKGKRKDYVWASTANASIQKMLGESDYVFLVSGKPDSQMLFNKQLHQIVLDRAKKKYGSIDNALDKILEIADKDGRNNKQVDAMRKMRELGADKYFKDSSNTDIGNFLKELKGQYDLKTDSDYRKAIRSIMPNTNELRDGFLKDNDFNFLDIMGVIKPSGVVDNNSSGHGTYRDGVRGEFVGIPDVKVPAYDLFTDDAKASFKDEMIRNSVSAKVDKYTKNKKTAPSDLDVQGFKDSSEKYAASFMDMPSKYHGVYSGGTVGFKSRDAETFINPFPEGDPEIKGSPSTQEQVADAASGIREQKSRTASDEEMARGLSNDGMSILEKYGMTEDYRGVRGVLDSIKGEYTDLGLDKNFIENYFPRSVQDLDGLKASYGQKTGIVDQEIRRYEKMTGQALSDTERQMMYEKLARSKLYRSGINAPNNMQERITDFIQEPQMQYYADPEVALDSYIDKMVNSIETKKLIGDSASGKTQGAEPVAGRLGEVMDKMASEGRLRDDQIDVIRGAVSARFGQHGAQYGFVKGAKNMGYLATMGNVGSTITQLGDFMFSMVQNGLIPTVEATLGKKNITIEDLGIAKDMVEIDSKQGAGMFSNSVNTVFKWTGLTAMDRLAKNTNINAAHKVLTKGAKAGQNTNSYKKTLARLKKIQGNDAYATIADLQSGKKSDLVIEALYNNLADVAPISITEMPEAYAGNPNLRIMYSLKSYTIKQFNFVRERVFTKIYVGLAQKNPQMIGEGMSDMMKILAFSTLANGSSDILKAIVFNREIDENEMFWNTFLRLFGVTKYTTVQIRKEGLGDAMLKTIAPPQFGMMSDVFKDVSEMSRLQEMKSTKFVPFVGKLYYWREGRGEDVEKRLSRLR
jgi:hypothetical protein